MNLAVKFKRLDWSLNVKSFVSAEREAAGFVYTAALNNKLHEHLSISREKREDCWRVYCEFETEYSTNDPRLCMSLDADYTLEEVKEFVQAGWEHCVCTSFFEEDREPVAQEFRCVDMEDRYF